jgi:DNA sulfur modification protein DndD
MSTIIRTIAFNNFYNYSGEYDSNKYNFAEGLNIINADNGMGKSKLYNGFLWILENSIYDSDLRDKIDIKNAPLKLLSDKAKVETSNSAICGVKIVFDNGNYQYTVEKSIKFTKKHSMASTSNPDDWEIADPRIDVSKMNLTTRNTAIVYDVTEQLDIIGNKIISPAMRSYALLQGEAIDNIVDLSNEKKLASTVDTLTDISELKEMEKSCLKFARDAQADLQNKQKESTKNREKFELLQDNKKQAEQRIEQTKESYNIYKVELQLAMEKAEKLQAQVTNTKKRTEFQTRYQELAKTIDSANKELASLLAGINDKIFNRNQPWLLLGSQGFVSKFIELRDDYNAERLTRKKLKSSTLLASILPEGSPDDVSLDKMLEQCQCFVCGRNVEKDDEAYKHIETIRNRSKAKPEEDESDMHKFFDRIQTNVAPYSRVDDIFGSIAAEREKIKTIQEQIKYLKGEQANALSEYFNYGGEKETLNGESDNNLLNEYNKATEDISRNKGLLQSAKDRIDSLNEDIKNYDKQMAGLSGAGVPKSYSDLRDILVDVQAIFENTKKRIYNEVIDKLEKNSNYYYSKLTAGNNVIGGTLKFEKTSYDSIQIKVLTELGDELSGASEGFQRMKKIAVIMAIISSRIGAGQFTYPFIADAPFSAFGKNFINNFFDVIPSVFSQSIIMIKDLYDIDNKENFLSEDGKKILKKYKDGVLKGTFYVNIIPEATDTTKLYTDIKQYN